MLRAVTGWLDTRGKSAGGTFLRVALLWNPLLCAGFSLLFDDLDRFPESFGGSMLIATVALATSFGTDRVVALSLAILRRQRGLPPLEHGPGWHLLVAALGLPAGLFLGFMVRASVTGAPAPMFEDYALGIVIGFTVLLSSILYETLSDLREARQVAELRAKEAENERLRGKLAALTAQMNPHLLFNALNTVASLAHDDPHAAEETAVELASLYRGVLEATRRELHPLSDELELCRAQLAIERVRFGPRLSYRAHVAEDVDAQRVLVPPLVVQPLVENAVKHGLEREGGTVTLSARRTGDAVEVEVRDDGVGYRPERSSSGTGTALDNVRHRLGLTYGEHASLTVSPRPGRGTSALVRIPATEGASQCGHCSWTTKNRPATG